MILFGLVFLIYSIIVFRFILGNKKISVPQQSTSLSTMVSVIIPFKDEEENLSILISALLNQDYNSELIEFIFVNDHSVDHGRKELPSLLKNCSFRFQIIDLVEKTGKKSAIDLGIQQAKNEFILITDADCTMPNSWVSSMITEFESSDSKFIAGPVGIEAGSSFLRRLMQLEFASLIASTSGAFGLNKAIMCNGANLGFTKEIYKELNPYESNLDIASGDDVFFLHQLKAKGIKTSFCANPESLVITKGVKTIKEFIHQRIRWAAKSKSYRDKDTIVVGVSVFSTNLALLYSVVWLFAGQISSGELLSIFLYKSILDTALIYSAKKWTSSKNIILNSLLLSFIYPFYSVGIALLSLVFKPTWKGRK